MMFVLGESSSLFVSTMAASAVPAVSISGLNFRYDGHQALRNINFTLRAGALGCFARVFVRSVVV